MGRKYIGIELGEHAYTHCIPRLNKVIEGEQGGISKSVNWQGGGGYKFYELAPTLILKDKHGIEIISPDYNKEMLVAAVAKLNGYIYSPDNLSYWKQGKIASSGNSYIYVTTTYFTRKELDSISSELGENESLVICCPAFDVGLNKAYDNIDIRKIPQSVLSKCEFNRENYNLNIVNPPEFDEGELEEGDE
jgi:adenine-specific DNA-methyltransferase